jgi:glycine/D-amino acid oxidase-like deaminating enzyme
VYCALTPEHMPLLRRQHEERTAAGLGGRWLEAAVMRRIAGLDSTAATRTTGNAQADPYLACLGFLRAAAAREARLYERSPVEKRAVVSRCHGHDGARPGTGTGTADRVTFGFLAAGLLLDWYRGDRSADHDLFTFGRMR